MSHNVFVPQKPGRSGGSLLENVVLQGGLFDTEFGIKPDI